MKHINEIRGHPLNDLVSHSTSLHICNSFGRTSIHFIYLAIKIVQFVPFFNQGCTDVFDCNTSKVSTVILNTLYALKSDLNY